MTDVAALVPAAQYLRMSTEHQRYSLAAQAEAIAEFAGRRGYDVRMTYFDPGRSGLTLRQRPGLQALLAAAVAPARDFDAVLVLDVSRWGRFQDADESAHYEFICRGAGVDVVYCGEPFENDGSPGSALIKQIKRVMAAEYSRELSSKTVRARRQQALLGFHQGGSVPYGVRRVAIEVGGRRRIALQPGEWKGLASDRVILVPGPAEERAVLRWIFRRYVHDRRSFETIARELNAKGTLGAGSQRWSRWAVRTLISSELMIGVYVFGRYRSRLKGRRSKTPDAELVRARVFEPLISPPLFRRAAERFAAGTRDEPKRDSKTMLRGLKELLKREGRLSGEIIDRSREVPRAITFKRHFGTLARVYAAIGYDQNRGMWPGAKHEAASNERLLQLLRELYSRQGYICGRLIDEAPELPGHMVYRRRFGSLANAYDLADLPLLNLGDQQRAGYLRSLERGTAAVCTGVLKMPRRHSRWSNDDLLNGLLRIAARDGYVSETAIHADPDLPTSGVYRQRFGSIFSAYAMVGLLSDRRELWSLKSIRQHEARRAKRQTRDTGAML